MLLEKAYAKIHGSYERIEQGQSELVMRDLTGCPSWAYNIKPEEIETPELLDKIGMALDKEYLVCVNTDEMS